MTLPAAKSIVRAQALGKRAAVAVAIRHAFAASLAAEGLRIVRHHVEAHAVLHSPVAAFFHAVRGEPDTEPLVTALAEARVITALPVPIARRRPLRFLAWRPGDPLVPGRFGIAEPLPSEQDLVPDVLFVPLAAFDRRGFRLGYGAGYYDASLAALRRRKPVLAVGVAFSVQEVDAVPTEAHDEPLDAVVTEQGLLTFGPR